jgi:hypothetical protein
MGKDTGDDETRNEVYLWGGIKMNINELPNYIAFMQRKPTKLEMMEQQIELAKELIASGVLTHEDIMKIFKGEPQAN